jgi:hypothetical protein
LLLRCGEYDECDSFCHDDADEEINDEDVEAGTK